MKDSTDCIIVILVLIILSIFDILVNIQIMFLVTIPLMVIFLVLYFVFKGIEEDKIKPKNLNEVEIKDRSQG